MRLLTLLAGYAAGLAVAMKYRKDNGTSKLNDVDATKTKLNSFIDEVVDIHKTAYADVKGFISARDELSAAYNKIQSKFSENTESKTSEEVPDVKPVRKKAPVKSPKV